MTDAAMPRRWYPAGGSVRGSSHVATGRPNEDAWAASPAGATAVAAVADGHGSTRCCRSDEGAQAAAALAVEVVAPLAAQAPSAAELETALRGAAATILSRWQAHVIEATRARPFTAEERAAIGAEEPNADETLLAYGTTLALVCGTEHAMGFLAIGDSDIVAVLADGTTVVEPLPTDPSNIGHFTSSLAQADALDHARASAIDLTAQPMLLAWASTDGYGGAFVDERWWEQVGRDFADRTSRLGAAEIAERIPSWLEEPASVAGDDTTMAVLLADPPPPRPESATIRLADIPPVTVVAPPIAPPSAPPSEPPTPVVPAVADTPPVAPVAAAATRADEPPRSRRGLYLLIAVLSVLAVVVGFLVGMALRDSGTAKSSAPASDSVTGADSTQASEVFVPASFVLSSSTVGARIDPSAGTAQATAATSTAANPLEAEGDDGVVWHVDDGSLLRRVDGKDTAVATLGKNVRIGAVAVEAGEVWLLLTDGSAVLHVEIADPCMDRSQACKLASIPVTGRTSDKSTFAPSESGG